MVLLIVRVCVCMIGNALSKQAALTKGLHKGEENHKKYKNRAYILKRGDIII